MTVYLVGGLPGSGKSHVMYGLRDQGLIDRFIDDYYCGSMKENDYVACPEKSHYFDALKKSIENDETVAVAEILFVLDSELRKMTDFIKREWPGVEVEYILFTNEPEVAKHNVRARAHKHSRGMDKIDAFCNYIDENSNQYVPEKYSGAIVAPTYGGDLWNREVKPKLE